MEFLNHSGLPADAFQPVDQFDQNFHVFVARQTLSFASGVLRLAEVQQPLCTADRGFDDGLTGSVRQESDYCPFKPYCDVIVNATAHPPTGRTVKSYPVRLRLWRQGERVCVVDKTLTVFGERQIKRRSIPSRLLRYLVKLLTLALVRPAPWRITAPLACYPMPVRYEFAYGGECLVKADDARVKAVPKKLRLTAEQAASHPAATTGEAPPIAHTAFDPNPIGRGFAHAWYLRARRISTLAAPQILVEGAEWTAKTFCRWFAPQRLKECENSAMRQPAGFGALAKTHPDRRTLVGTVDAAFIASDAHLPADFDFAIWNAAPKDQQIEYPNGGEEFELANLCAAETPGTRKDAGGNRYLRLTLPRGQCTLRFSRAGSGDLIVPMMIDTILIEPEERTISVVWRRTILIEEVDSKHVELHFASAPASIAERVRRAIDPAMMSAMPGVCDA